MITFQMCSNWLFYRLFEVSQNGDCIWDQILKSVIFLVVWNIAIDKEFKHSSQDPLLSMTRNANV